MTAHSSWSVLCCTQLPSSLSTSADLSRNCEIAAPREEAFCRYRSILGTCISLPSCISDVLARSSILSSGVLLDLKSVFFSYPSRQRILLLHKETILTKMSFSQFPQFLVKSARGIEEFSIGQRYRLRGERAAQISDQIHCKLYPVSHHWPLDFSCLSLHTLSASRPPSALGRRRP